MKERKHTLRDIGLVLGVTLLTKILGVAREALQARAFGTELAFDLYSISYNHTIYIFTTVAYALCVAAVPIISKRLAESRESAYRTAGNLITVSVLASLLLAALLFVLARLAPIGKWFGVAAQNVPVFRGYLQMCIATLPLIVLIYLLVAVFQSMDHYTLQGSLSLPYNILLIVFLALFASSERMGEYVAVICFAWILQLAMTVPSAVKERFRYYPSFDLKNEDLKFFFQTTVVTVFTTSIFLWCYLADSATVTRFGEGAASAVYYADKLFTPVATTLIYSISVVLFPKYNHEYARSGEAEYKRYVGQTVENTLFVILPFSAMFCVFAVPVIHVLYESGNFSEASTRMTSNVFAMYSLGMAGFCVLDLINKAFYTMRKTMLPLLINAIVLALDLMLNALVRSSHSELQVSLVTAAALTVGGILALITFFRTQRAALHTGRILKNLASAGIMSAALWFLSRLLYHPESSKLMVLLIHLLLGVIGLGIYAAACWLLGEREALLLITKKFRKQDA